MEFYRFGMETAASVPADVDVEVMQALWEGFCFRIGSLKTQNGVQNRIGIGEATYLPLADGDEYTICVRRKGIGLQGRDTASLMRAFGVLLTRIETCAEPMSFLNVPVGEVHGVYSVSRRMIHLCVFPETDLSMLRRLVRLCGVLSYTHVVLEFWGMLKYDCLAELAWPHAFSKEEIKPIIREARAMGVEPIPMINHLGHASSCRIDTGKHVVLDQKPSLQYLFTPDGWCWDIFSPHVRTLLKQMRKELCELFGAGEYFHIGCDEAHFYSSEYYPLSALCDYLRELTAEVALEGRRPILWGDMIVPYDCSSDKADRAAAAWKKAAEMKPLMKALDRGSVIADWHYDVKTAPVPSVLEFARNGFDVMGCPWDKPANIDAQHATAVAENTYGLMMTTWHTMHANISAILYFARKCGFPKVRWSDAAGHRNLEIATLLRKVAPARISYEECGFAHRQTEEVIDW